MKRARFAQAAGLFFFFHTAQILWMKFYTDILNTLEISGLLRMNFTSR
jgi:hypothetical protein